MRKSMMVLILGMITSMMVWASPPSMAVDHASDVPVLWVHGITPSAGCPGIRTAKQAAPLAQVLAANGYTGTVYGIDYYCGDSTGLSIRGAAGPDRPGYKQAGYNANTSNARLGLDLAWFVYNTFSVKGQYVNFATHSMGGLFTEYAITHAGEPGFPPFLLVHDVVTFSTPYGGIDKSNTLTPEQYKLIWCGNYTECNELMPGSPFLTDLAQQSLPSGVDWTTIGGGTNDIMTYQASTTSQAQHAVDLYSPTPVKYNHTNYITDTSMAFDVPARVSEQGGGTTQTAQGAHSLNWGARAIMSSDW